MKCRPLTREESRDQTRQHLLESALTAFMKNGFTATSVQSIASAAGYTRGAFYSNFHDKPELLLELLRRDHESMRGDLSAIFGKLSSCEAMEACILHFYGKLHRENTRSLLWIEAKLLAVRDVHFRARFNTLTQEQLAQLGDCIREFSTRVGTPLILPADTLAIGLMALHDGVQFFHMLAPLKATESVMQSALTGFFAQAVFFRRSE
jgi:AcrR family transcriptional regulator